MASQPLWVSCILGSMVVCTANDNILVLGVDLPFLLTEPWPALLFKGFLNAGFIDRTSHMT